MNYLIGNRIYTLPAEFKLNSSEENFYCPLNHLGVIDVLGANAEQFLQGQLTNNINNIHSAVLQKNLLCNLKGQIITKIWVKKDASGIQMICNVDLMAEVLKLLEKTAMLSKVKLGINPNIKLYGIIKPNTVDASWFKIDEASFIGFNCPSMRELPEINWHYQNLIQKNFDIYPLSSREYVPHHLQLENDWVSFNKGCYRGQEIIARMHYLGKSKYQVISYHLKQSHLPQPGDIFYNEKNENMGKIIDACPITPEECIVLACVRK